MPYTIPNEAGAGFTDQAEPDKVDFDILTAGMSHGASGTGFGTGPTGVESGCAVTAQGTPDMTVAVAAGVARIGGRRVVVAGGNVTITAADGTNPRFDLIVVDTAAAKTAIAGTAAANAVFPAITTGKAVLAAVYVPASDTAINTNQITDKRIMVPQPSWEDVTWYGAVGDGTGDQSASIQAAMDAAEVVAGTTGRGVVYFPQSSGKWRVTAQITWKDRVSVFSARSTVIQYAGTALADGVIITENSGANNVQYNQWVGIGIEGGTSGNLLADYGIRFIEGAGKVDWGTVIRNAAFQNFNKSAIRLEGGITNFFMSDFRSDHCNEYGIDLTRSTTANRTIDYVEIRDFTYDNGGATVQPRGAIRIDQGNQAPGDGECKITIRNAHIELNYTKVTTTTDSQTLPQGTINVTDTSTFQTAGSISITTNTGAKTRVSYTGKTGTTFTGCTGGTGTYAISAEVVQAISQGVFDLIQPVTDANNKITHVMQLDNIYISSPVNVRDTFPFVKVRKSDGTNGTGEYVPLTGYNLLPLTRSMLDDGASVLDMGEYRRLPQWAWGPRNTGTGQQSSLVFTTPMWLQQINIPTTPPTGFHAFYVDAADAIFKSKDSTGKISVYGSRTRSAFIDASILRMDAATGVKLGTPPNAVDGIQLADGLTSGGYCNFIMPVDVITGTITVRPIWVPGATDGVAHTVRWQMNIRIISAADVTATGTSVAWTGVSATRTINVEVLETGQASTGVSPAANDRVRLEIQRIGGDGVDTYVGAVILIGLRLDYLANN